MDSAMTPTPVHHRAKGARITDCGRSMGLDLGRGLRQMGERAETVLRDARQTTCEGCLDVAVDRAIARSRNRPLHSVAVGDRVRLMPDAAVRIRHSDYRFNPNSSLGIAMDAWHVVTHVSVVEGIVLVGVEGSDRRVDMRRFTAL